VDPLSDVLSLLKPRSYVSAGFDAGGDWSIQFRDQQDFIKCYVVVSGQCWMSVDGVPDPVRLKSGDCFVLASGRPFRLASDLSLTPVDFRAVLATARPGAFASINGGGDFVLGSHFILDGAIWKLRDSRIAALLLDGQQKSPLASDEKQNSLGAASRWLTGSAPAARALRIATVAVLFLWAGVDQLHFWWSSEASALPALQRAAELNPDDSSVQARLARAEQLAFAHALHVRGQL